MTLGRKGGGAISSEFVHPILKIITILITVREFWLWSGRSRVLGTSKPAIGYTKMSSFFHHTSTGKPLEITYGTVRWCTYVYATDLEIREKLSYPFKKFERLSLGSQTHFAGFDGSNRLPVIESIYNQISRKPCHQRHPLSAAKFRSWKVA